MQPPKVPDDVTQAFREARTVKQLIEVGGYMKPFIEEFGKAPIYGAGFLMFSRECWQYYYKRLKDEEEQIRKQGGTPTFI